MKIVHRVCNKPGVSADERRVVGDILNRHLAGIEQAGADTDFGQACLDRLKFLADTGNRTAILLGESDGVAQSGQSVRHRRNEGLRQHLHPAENRWVPCDKGNIVVVGKNGCRRQEKKRGCAHSGILHSILPDMPRAAGLLPAAVTCGR